MGPQFVGTVDRHLRRNKSNEKNKIGMLCRRQLSTLLSSMLEIAFVFDDGSHVIRQREGNACIRGSVNFSRAERFGICRTMRFAFAVKIFLSSGGK